MMRIRFLLLAGFLAIACSAAPAEKLKVLTTIPPVYCFTANIAGRLAEVSNLLPPGTAAHDFQFTFADRRKLEDRKSVV